MPVLTWAIVGLGVLLAVACRLIYACVRQHGRDLLRIEALERQAAQRSSREEDRAPLLPVHSRFGPPVRENPRRAENLDISLAEDGYIVCQPQLDRVHFLNAEAALILELCNGKNSEREIAGLIGDGYGLKEIPAEAVGETLAKMKAEGLLR
jgi:hypothetical protein